MDAGPYGALSLRTVEDAGPYAFIIHYSSFIIHHSFARSALVLRTVEDAGPYGLSGRFAAPKILDTEGIVVYNYTV